MTAALDAAPRLGSTSAREFTPPLAEHASAFHEFGIAPEHTWGYSCIEFCEKFLGWELLPWQKWLYVRALEKDITGTRLRFQTLVILVARQNGKSRWLKGLTLWRIYLHKTGQQVPGAPPAARLALIAMQSLDYAESLLADAEEDIKNGHKLVRREFIKRWTANGKHRLAFKGRRMWKATTANRKGGRSFSVDQADLDELREHQRWDAYNAISPTVISRPNGLVCCTSNAGDSTSVVLRSLRDGARKAIKTGKTAMSKIGFFEWSVPDEVDPKDPKYWYQANPAMGHPQTGLTLEGLQGALEAMEFTNMSGFRTEHLALDVNTPILTVGGWKLMGEIQVGDEVYHPSGHPIKVTHTTPIFQDRTCYQVTTTDGRSVVADAEHNWLVNDRRSNRGWEVMNTAKLVALGVTRNKGGGGRYAFRLPAQQAIVSKPVDLPIEPYLLGAWLGDGTAGKSEITCIDSEADELTRLLAVDITSARKVGNARRINFRIAARGSRDGFPARCRALGVWQDKHIPAAYLTAGTEQRLALLQGLCDTDGSIDPAGRVQYCSTRKRLAEQVLYLARSLGWRATLTEGVSGYGGKVCGPAYWVSWTHDASEPAPFRLQRKLARINARPSRAGERTAISIRSVTPVSSRAVRCITVASPDSMFLAGETLVPTRNCQWVDALDPGIIPAEHWFDTFDSKSKRASGTEPVYACVDVNYQRSKAYVAVAGRRADGNIHFEVVAAARGVDWVIPWLTERKGKFTTVAVQKLGAPASNLIPLMEKANIPVREWGGSDLPQGCQSFYDKVVQHLVFHRPAPTLDRAAAATVAKTLGDAWAFDRKNSPVDAAPLVAAAGAVWALEKGPLEIKIPQAHGWDPDKIAQWERDAREKGL